MNAAKKLRKLIVSGLDDRDVLILTDLARSLAMGETFVLARLNELSMRNFDLALELINDWRFDHHIPARRRLAEALSPKAAAAPDSVAAAAEQPASTEQPEPATDATTDAAAPAADAVETAAEDLFTEAAPAVAPAAKKPRASRAKAKPAADKAD